MADATKAAPDLTYQQFDDAWKAARDAVAWPANRYPRLPALLREALPMKNGPDKIEAADRAKLLKNLETLATAADELSRP